MHKSNKDSENDILIHKRPHSSGQSPIWGSIPANTELTATLSCIKTEIPFGSERSKHILMSFGHLVFMTMTWNHCLSQRWDRGEMLCLPRENNYPRTQNSAYSGSSPQTNQKSSNLNDMQWMQKGKKIVKKCMIFYKQLIFSSSLAFSDQSPTSPTTEGHLTVTGSCVWRGSRNSASFDSTVQ